MVGRGVFSNPWFFNPSIDPSTKTPTDRIKLAKKHLKHFTELWGNDKHFDVMKKFFKIYISGFDGAKELRIGLMQTKTKKEVFDILSKSVPHS
jgi:tRNA-dihydrouridine synthase